MILEIFAYISVGVITLGWIIALAIDLLEKLNRSKFIKKQTNLAE